MPLTTAEKCARYRAKDVEGYRKKKREYARTPEERAKRTEYMRKWRELNREKHNQQAKESHHRNKHKHKGKQRSDHLKRNYGLTTEDYDSMLSGQGGACLICGTKQPARGRFHVDHCHDSGFVRGLLCARCNGALGWFEKYMNNIVSYLNGTE